MGIYTIIINSINFLGLWFKKNMDRIILTKEVIIDVKQVNIASASAGINIYLPCCLFIIRFLISTKLN